MAEYKGYFYENTMTNAEFNCLYCGTYVPFGGWHSIVHCSSKKFCSLSCFRSWADMNPKSDGCFITTATCKSRNLPDDCHELTTLRTFRDNFMKKDDEMKSEVMEYYEIAPSICSKIDRLENSSEIYDSIWSDYLCGAVDAVDAGDNLKAHEIYKSMVFDLKSRFLNEEGE